MDALILFFRNGGIGIFLGFLICATVLNATSIQKVDDVTLCMLRDDVAADIPVP